MAWDFARDFRVEKLVGNFEKRAPGPVRIVINFDLGLEIAAPWHHVIDVGWIIPAKERCWRSAKNSYHSLTSFNHQVYVYLFVTEISFLYEKHIS